MRIPTYDVLEEIGRHGAYLMCRGRRQSDGLPVLLQAAAGPEPDRSHGEALERQFELLHGSPISGVTPPLAVVRGDRLYLVLEDRGLQLLRARTPLDIEVWLSLAARVARILDEIHRRGLVHTAVTPGSVLLNEDASDVQLLNLGLAITASKEDAGSTSSTMAYMAPEQTGRVRRAVDHRSDLYGLGATLYAALTGAPPFVSEDPLEVIHAHLAKTPAPPSAARAGVPEQLSRILLKLLAKSPEDRYQSASGLRRDLERCREALASGRDVPLFPPGADDAPARFTIPARLYGRERELNALLTAFNGARDGLATLMLVSGYSGIGKTSLIQEFQRAVVGQRGYFVAGKFDQVVRNIPYGAFTQALRSLVAQLLTEPEERLHEVRSRLTSALGTNGGVLTEVIPDVENLLGPQAPPPPLDPVEARNRFAYVFQRFVGALADVDRLLVLFLDDLQWVDAATLDLLHALLTDPEIQHLLLIGAYRDNEVDAGHLLTWAVNKLEASGAPVSRVWLGPLTPADLTAFVADALRRDDPEVAALADSIQTKTEGNPFFVIQFLKTLEQEGQFVFDGDHGGWSFDLSAIASASITDNVVDLMSRRIRRLSPSAQRCLTLAACVGSRFDGDTVLAVSGLPRDTAARALAEAADAGLIHESATATAYEFLHDRVQQAAYGLVPESRMRPLHLNVGRLLLADAERDGSDDRIFTVVNHLNIGAPLMDAPEERLALARLNLAAGRKAKTSAAYLAAADYFARGASLLGPAEWTTQHELLFALRIEAAECQYLSGSYERAEPVFAELLEHAATPLERAQVHSLRITFYENQSRWADAMAAAREGLALFDVAFPESTEGAHEALEREIAEVQALLEGRAIAELAELPSAADPGSRTLMRMLTLAWAPAYVSGRVVLARLISATIVRLSLTHGNTEDSAYGYVTHAITVGPIRGDYASAYQWGVLALNVNARFNDVRRRAKIHQQFQAHVNLWSRPFDTCIPHARIACQSGLETGDFPYAAYGAATEAWSAWMVCRDIERFVRDFSPTLALLDKLNMADFRAAHRVVLNWARALQGRTLAPGSLSDAAFDEVRYLEQYRETAPFFLTFVYAARLQLFVLLERFPEALAAARSGEAAAPAGTIWPLLIEFWGALAAAAAFDSAPENERGGLHARIETASRALEPLAASCPENFRCMALTVAAEAARIDGRPADAAALYERAIAYGRQTGNLQQEAVAHKCAARMWLALDEARARPHLNEAYRCLAEWGATAVLAHLEERYGAPLAAARQPMPFAQPAPARSAVHPDVATVLKVASAIAGEIEIDGLLRQLLRLALENAGAQRGVFIQIRDGALSFEAEARADTGLVRIGPPAAIDHTDELPHSVVRYVRRTGHDVVLGNAALDERFATDPYILRAHPKSILCVPLGHHGRLGGILYLENSLTADAFSADRIEMVRILAGQTGIALENARLYAELAALKNRLEAENVYLQEEIRTQHNFNEIAGTAPALLDALRHVERVAPTDSTVLIAGETGSGKELFARAIHSRSRRSARPLVKVNCGAIPPGLVESELFGHVKGAFTGAIDKRVGRFELADGGTIFLDEVGELPLDAQVKLLRVLQEQEFEPVGSSRTVRVSVRVIAATNRNLDDAVREGRFRADLLYRLNVFPIRVPPLRERRSDIPLLAAFFITALARRIGKEMQGFSTRSMERLLEYAWPGNVRELQNVVERAAILAQGPVLEVQESLLGAAPAKARQTVRAERPLTAADRASLEDVQRTHILQVLSETGGVVEGARGAASILGLHPNTLRSRMKKLGIATRRAES